jgi:hypothetical protein
MMAIIREERKKVGTLEIRREKRYVARAFPAWPLLNRGGRSSDQDTAVNGE